VEFRRELELLAIIFPLIPIAGPSSTPHRDNDWILVLASRSRAKVLTQIGVTSGTNSCNASLRFKLHYIG
jgi:hypothetical protein